MLKELVDLREKIEAFKVTLHDFQKEHGMAPKRPDMVKKQDRVKKILDEPAVQEKMKKKVAKKRDRKCIEAIVKAGGDDSHPDVVKFVAKKPKGGEKEVSFVAKSKPVSNKSAEPKSLRGGHARQPNKNAPVASRSS
jgi:hypothetical protein